MVSSDEHGQSFFHVLGSDGIVERVEHLVVGHAVLPGARGDGRLHCNKLPWTTTFHKLLAVSKACKKTLAT